MAKVGVLRIWGWLRMLKRDAIILYYAWKHPRTPPYIKGLLAALVAYVVSPIDILPDYFPVLGLVDDVALVPAAILYILYLLPDSVRKECEKDSEKWQKGIPIVLGLLIAALIMWMVLLILGVGHIISSFLPSQ